MGILTKKKKKVGREGRKAKPAGYCVSLQDPETKPPCPPQGKIWKVFGGWRGEERQGWRMGLKYNPKGVTYFCGVSWPPALHYNLFISFSFYLLSSDLPISFALSLSLSLFLRSVFTQFLKVVSQLLLGFSSG